MIVYDKLFKLLDLKGLNKNYLRKNGIHADTVDYLIHNKDVKISSINKLCALLDCNPEDILTYIPDNTDINK